jgi:cellulose biosynthesis protein BcsQ
MTVMQQNKIMGILILTLAIILSLVFFQNRVLVKKMDNLGRLTNNLYLERDFIIYEAFNENNLSKIKKNLNLNFMFHLTPIETDGIQNMLNIQSLDRICKKYNRIKTQFNNEYEKKYPSSIRDLNSFCNLK